MNDIKGKIIDFKQMADYHENSVVSSEIVRSDKGTVSLFALDRGQGLSEHTAPYDAVACIIDGVAKIRIKDRIFTVEAGKSIIMPANVPHALDADNRFKMLLIMIRG